jgi:hypothetical protein
MQIQIKGLEELKASLSGFSDRRFDAAIATALTRAGKTAQTELKAEMLRVFDRPTPFTLNALRLWPARADKLTATVGFRDDGTGGANANNYLMPNVEGGRRVSKRVEAALRAVGALPDGWYAVPGQGANLDSYGNMSRGQIIQILSQLRITMTAGHNRNMAFDARKQISAQRKAGGRFFVMRIGSKVQPGVYQSEMIGRNITPVLVFVRQPTYQKRYAFWEKGEAIANAQLPIEIQRSVAEHIERLAKKGGR